MSTIQIWPQGGGVSHWPLRPTMKLNYQHQPSQRGFEAHASMGPHNCPTTLPVPEAQVSDRLEPVRREDGHVTP